MVGRTVVLNRRVLFALFRFTIYDCIWFPHPCSLWFCASVLITKLQRRPHRGRPTTRRPSIVIPAAVRIGSARSIGRAISMKSPLRPFFRLNTEPSPCDGARGVSREVGFAHTASFACIHCFPLPKTQGVVDFPCTIFDCRGNNCASKETKQREADLSVASARRPQAALCYT